MKKEMLRRLTLVKQQSKDIVVERAGEAFNQFVNDQKRGAQQREATEIKRHEQLKEIEEEQRTETLDTIQDIKKLLWIAHDKINEISMTEELSAHLEVLQDSLQQNILTAERAMKTRGEEA